MAENVLAAGAENRPPMLEKGWYDSWKSVILLYIEGKENGEMLFDLIKHGHFQFKEITVLATQTTVEHKRMQELKDLSPEEKFVVPSFLPTDDPIASLNKAMMFLSTAMNSRYFDEALTVSAIYMARLSPTSSVNGNDVNATYDSDILFENDDAKSVPPPKKIML
ncbi:hypothetical protein Tco_1318381 [Tanacetum coccineum]